MLPSAAGVQSILSGPREQHRESVIVLGCSGIFSFLDVLGIRS